MKRPLADRRVIGPLFSQGSDEEITSFVWEHIYLVNENGVKGSEIPMSEIENIHSIIEDFYSDTAFVRIHTIPNKSSNGVTFYAQIKDDYTNHFRTEDRIDELDSMLEGTDYRLFDFGVAQERFIIRKSHQHILP